MDVFDVVSMQRLKSLAEAANRVGVLGRCSAMVVGEYKVSLMFELESCYQAVLASANDEFCNASPCSCDNNCGRDNYPPFKPTI